MNMLQPGSWFRQEYYVDEEYIRPLPGASLESYHPMAYYRHGNRVSDNLHHMFASLDTNNIGQVIEYYNKFGSLGNIGRDILTISPAYKTNDINTGSLVVLRDSDVLIPAVEFVEKYDVPINIYLKKRMEAKELLNKLDLMKIAGEPLKWFQEQQTKFRLVLDTLNALNQNDIDKIDRLGNELLKEQKSDSAYSDMSIPLNTRITKLVIKIINNELANKAYPQLATTVDMNGKTEIMNKFNWECDSLLSYLYMMVVMDIERGVISSRCDECSIYFETNRKDQIYCSTKCQSRANTRKFRSKSE